MLKENLFYIPFTIAKDVLKVGYMTFEENIEKFAIPSAKYDLEDMGADSENVKVEYPIKIEFQEDGTANVRVPIRVSYKEAKDN